MTPAFDYREKPSADCRRIGLLALSANPPHQSHGVIAEEALTTEKLDAVLFVIARQHVNKPVEGASFEERMAMLMAAFKHEPKFSFAFADSGRYLHLTENLKKEFPNATPVLLLGTDNLLQMAEFNKPGELIAFARLGAELSVHPRHSDEAAVRREWKEHPDLWPEAFQKTVHFRATYAEPMQSSGIREKIAAGQDWLAFVPPVVAEHIQTKKLYR